MGGAACSLERKALAALLKEASCLSSAAALGALQSKQTAESWREAEWGPEHPRPAEFHELGPRVLFQNYPVQTCFRAAPGQPPGASLEQLSSQPVSPGDLGTLSFGTQLPGSLHCPSPDTSRAWWLQPGFLGLPPVGRPPQGAPCMPSHPLQCHRGPQFAPERDAHKADFCPTPSW